MSILERVLQLLKLQGKKESELCKFIGINQSTLATWKKRNTEPPASLIYKMAEFFNVSTDYLLTGKEATEKGLSIDTALLLADLQFDEQFLEIAKMYKELSAERQQDIYDYVQMLHNKEK